MRLQHGLSQWLLIASSFGLVSAHVIDRGLVHARQASTAGQRTPPQEPWHFNQTKESLLAINAELIKTRNDTINTILATVTVENATFENVVLPIADPDNRRGSFYGLLQPYDTNLPGFRDVIEEVDSTQDRLINGIAQNKDYYALVRKVWQDNENSTTLCNDDKKFLQNYYRSFENSGIDLPPDALKRFNEINDLKNPITGWFSGNITDTPNGLWLTPEELDGLSQDLISTLEKGNGTNTGKLFLPATGRYYNAAITNVKNAGVRRDYSLQGATVGVPGNIELLDQYISLNDEQARLMGYNDTASWRLEGQQAKTPEAVKSFLSNLHDRIVPHRDEELKRMLALQQELGGNDTLYAWNMAFYKDQSNRRQWNISDDTSRAYFPAVATFERIVAWYSKLYSLSFDKVPTNGTDLVWHPDVELYAVWDAASDDDTFVGFFYTDIYARDDKEGGAYMAGADYGYLNKDGTRHYPAASLNTNFLKSATAKPTLLTQKEVTTIAHEFGHAVHQLVSNVKYASLHGPLRTPTDFMEAPSQLMEKLPKFAPVINMLSQHWSYVSSDALALWQQENPNQPQPPEKMPQDTVEDLINSANWFIGYDQTMQVFFSSFDINANTPATREDAEKTDSLVQYNTLYKEAFPVKGFEDIGFGPRWGSGVASIIHFVTRNYASMYYSYLWSLATAMDVLYTAGFDKDPLNVAQGTRWRDIVLKPGASKDYDEILEEFLGHKPNNDGLFRFWGL